jgi:glucose 1-dehydrogenase
MRLNGQAAIVTGASSGIGEGVALALAAAGAKVAVNYRSGREAAERVVERIRDGGGEAVAVGADVGDEAQVQDLFAQAAQAFGRLDILVANAGLQKDAAFRDMTLDQWRGVIETNLTGQFLCCREACAASSTRRSSRASPARAARSSASARSTRSSPGPAT